MLQCAWTFVLYPLLIYLLASVKSQRRDKSSGRDTGHPPITVVIAAHNEEFRIRARIENLLRCDYPADRLEILVVSDGSNDRTVEEAGSLQSGNVRVLDRPEKSGKPSCLNVAVEQASGEVLVFADARQTFAPDALLKLARHFADPVVGAVSGQLFPHASTGGTAQGIDFYWKLEKALRHAESRLESCIGCTGAIYAMRKELFQSIPPDTLLDDVVIPMQAALQGFRILFEPEAKAFDPQRLAPVREKMRKARTLAGNFQMLFRHPAWLLPWKNRLWWMLASHKYSRLLTPISLVAAFVGAWLARGVSLYTFFLWTQAGLYSLALLGMICRGSRFPVLSIPAGFVFLSIIIVRGFLYYLSGGYKTGWEKSSGH